MRAACVSPIVAGLISRLEDEGDCDAVTDARLTMTVGELAHGAASLASRLVDTPVEQPAVVLVDRSAASVQAIYGVHWAARPLVAFDVNEPASRLVELVGRLGRVSVVDSTGRGPTELVGQPVLRSQGLSSRWVDPVVGDPEGIGAILFTSGSTGRPKGVVRRRWQDYESARRIVASRPLSQGHRTAAFAPPQWLAGYTQLRRIALGEMCWLVDPFSFDPAELAEAIDRFGITTLRITPSLLQTLSAAMADGRRLDAVSLVALSGEGVDWSMVAAVRRLTAPDVQVRGGLAASEVWSAITTLVVGPGDPIGTGPLPLGRPNDPSIISLEPVGGPDDPAELIVRRSVADGYWNDPELTAQRFGVDGDGEPFWRSGDLVWVDDTGMFHYRGRTDQMVKINGRLVEPSEATMALSCIEGISRAVVLPRTLPSGRKQFVAHVETRPGTELLRVRADLADRLPAHLRPAVIMRHDAMPLTARGKLDRQALQGCEVVPWRDSPPIATHRTVERAVLGAATLVLGVNDISLDDDLWELGLDSLGALELVQLLADGVAAQLTVNDFIDASTPAQIAAVVSKHSRSAHRSNIVHIGAGSEGVPLVYVCGAGGTALAFRSLVAALGDIGPAMVIEQWGLHQRQRPDPTVEAVVARNLTDLRANRPEGPYVLLGHSWGGIVAHEMAALLAGEGERVALVMLDASRPGRKAPAAVADRSPKRWWLRRLAGRVYRKARWFAGAASAPGSQMRYDYFFTRALRMPTLVHPRSFVGPTLVAAADGSSVGASWPARPGLQVVNVPGDHNTMLQPPNTAELAAAVGAFISGLPDDHRLPDSSSAAVGDLREG